MLKRIGKRFPELASRLAAWRGGRSLRRAPAPIIVGGTGGSGTRSMALILAQAGVFMGHDVNEAGDSQPLSIFLRKWIPIERGWTSERLTGRYRARMDRELTVSLDRHRAGVSDVAAPWGAKNPRSMYLVSYLAEQCPGMRFIHMVRDGRDMAFSANQSQAESYYHHYFAEPADQPPAVRSIRFWARVNLEAREATAQALPGRSFCVRFEDLCADPCRQVEQIFGFLGLEANVERAAGVVQRPRTLGRWRDEDPAVLRGMVEAGGSALVRFGYVEGTDTGRSSDSSAR